MSKNEPKTTARHSSSLIFSSGFRTLSVHEKTTTTGIMKLPVSPVYGAAQDVLSYIKLDDTEKPLRRLGIHMAYIILLAVAAFFVIGGVVMFVVNKHCINSGETYRVN